MAEANVVSCGFCGVSFKVDRLSTEGYEGYLDGKNLAVAEPFQCTCGAFYIEGMPDVKVPKDPRLSIPAFREAHKVVCAVVHRIDKTKYHRIPELRAAAERKEPEAVKLLAEYEDAMAKRRATTKKAI
ncbi:MAG: hypothetical protein WC375_08795 [Methanomassiliicoccales archaeon]|jgi:hypothetical protein